MNSISNRSQRTSNLTPKSAVTPLASSPPTTKGVAKGVADAFEAKPASARPQVNLTGATRVATAAPASPSSLFASNDILSRYQSTGASAETASQDGLSAGVGASNHMADADLTKLLSFKPQLESAAQRYGLPPAVLAAIASRESRAGGALDSQGLGDNGNGFGVMQVDKRYHETVGGPYSQQHIDQAASILRDYLNQVSANHPSWPPEQQLRGAIAAYNFGPDNVHTQAGMDQGTTGNDYSNDVWARATRLASDFGGKVGQPDPTPTPSTQTPSLMDVRTKPETFLRSGMEGASVRHLQQLLGMSASEQDGKFGDVTRQKVMSFQAAHGLTPPAGKEGWVGATTLQHLEDASSVKPTPAPTPAPGTWSAAPTLAQVRTAGGQVRQGMEGEAVKYIQQRLGLEQDGKFGPATKQAVMDFQRSNGLTPPPGLEGVVGKTTLEALDKPQASGTVDLNNPTLQKLATGSLVGQGDFTCVASTLINMERLGVPQPAATGADTGNNPRGAMVQLVRDFGWKSLPLPGSHPQAIHSPAYGDIQANVISADAYEQLALAGKIPSGAVIFQTRHPSWNDNSEGSRGFDMGIVRNGGRETFNYQSNGPIIYGSAQSVVILVPGAALK